MGRILLIIAVATLFAPLNTVAAESAESFVARIQAKGPDSVVHEMYDSADWNRLMLSIGSGDPAWLKVARLLSPGTDGASAEELSAAAGDVLETNASEALRVLWSTFGLGMCQFLPNKEEPRYQTRQKAIAGLEKRIRNLRSVTRPELSPARDACINELRSWESEVEHIYAK